MRFCERYAYLIIGADHEGLHRVEALDIAVLEDRIGAYTNPGPIWQPRNIDVDGTNVLVIIVEPAGRWGDTTYPQFEVLTRKPRTAVVLARLPRTDVETYIAIARRAHRTAHENMELHAGDDSDAPQFGYIDTPVDQAVVAWADVVAESTWSPPYLAGGVERVPGEMRGGDNGSPSS